MTLPKSKRPLRIFYAAADSATAHTPGSQIWYYNLYLPLVDLGHDVVRFDFDFSRHEPHRDFTVASNQAIIAANRPNLEKQLLRQLEAAHRERPFDLFFSYFYTADITAETVQHIKSMGITTVNWYCNGSYQFHLVSDIAPFYDYCLVPEKFRLDDYRRVGANPIYCQEAANPTIYHPYDLPQEYDITFVGQKYGDRPVFIQHLLRQGLDVRVWGPNWQAQSLNVPKWRLAGSRIKRYLKGTEPLFPPKIPAERRGPPLSDEAMIQMYSRSKINLGFSNVADTTSGIKQVRLRDFEVPMSGGFYMVETMPELAEFFEYDKEIVGYTDKQELAEKAAYYLAHEQEREQIRQAGLARALRDHSWHKRFLDSFALMGLD
ncbi:MAG: glycosyltransferase [Anaerolineae bacterium]|nr:glycosyltransferase [Anaerolineae bacterium]